MLRRDLLSKFLAIPILARTVAADGAPSVDRRAAALDAFLRRQVKERRAVGIAAQVVRRNGEVIYAGATGLRDPAANDPIRQDTLFRLASMTKPLTAVAVLMLVEAGRIALDDPVGRFAPEFATPLVQVRPGSIAPASRVPTIRDLLRHTSGLSYRFMNVPGIVEAYERLGVDDGMAAPDLALSENLRRLSRAPLQAQPGTRWGYGLSFDVLGAVVERVADQSLESFIRERIAAPLGLASLAFHVPPEGRRRMARAMMLDKLDDRGLRPISGDEGVSFPVTNGRIICDPERAFSLSAYPSGGSGATSTLGDYVRFARLLLNAGVLDGVRLLRAQTVAAMSSPQTSDLPINLAGPGYDFGYGVAVLTDPAAAKTRQPRGAYGWSGVYGTGFSIDPASGLAAVVMTQTAVEGMLIADEFVRAFYDLSGSL
jgi:CubicO group peptidase (beta-lactamase class C family)